MNHGSTKLSWYAAKAYQKGMIRYDERDSEMQDFYKLIWSNKLYQVLYHETYFLAWTSTSSKVTFLKSLSCNIKIKLVIHNVNHMIWNMY